MPAEDQRSGVISVREIEGVWRIECNDRAFGSYRTCDSALWDAVATAMQARAAGRSARVDLHEAAGIRTVWPKEGAPWP